MSFFLKINGLATILISVEIIYLVLKENKNNFVKIRRLEFVKTCREHVTYFVNKIVRYPYFLGAQNFKSHLSVFLDWTITVAELSDISLENIRQKVSDLIIWRKYFITFHMFSYRSHIGPSSLVHFTVENTKKQQKYQILLWQKIRKYDCTNCWGRAMIHQ